MEKRRMCCRVSRRECGLVSLAISSGLKIHIQQGMHVTVETTGPRSVVSATSEVGITGGHDHAETWRGDWGKLYDERAVFPCHSRAAHQRSPIVAKGKGLDLRDI